MEENKLAIQNELTNEDIKNLIYTIRGKQVMLDSDVARLYNYQTKRVNETVSRNKKRFPENFCFQLSEEEVKNLKRQTTILNLDQIYAITKSISNCQIKFHDSYKTVYVSRRYYRDLNDRLKERRALS